MQDTLHVLLVEDNPADARLIREIAAEHAAHSWDIRCCQTLGEALDLLARQRFDIILLDLSLPDSQGLETVRSVLARADTTPLVVMTGAADAERAQQAIHLGAEDYVAKQELNAELLCRSIAYAIERADHRRRVIQSERRFRELAEMLPEVVFECDLEGNLTFVNAVGMSQYGYTQLMFEQGLNAFDMIAPDDRGRAHEGFAHVLQGTAERGGRYTALRRDGTTFPVTLHSTAILKDGNPVGLRGIIVDVAKRVEAQRALQTAEQIVSAIPSGLLIYRYEPPDRLVLISGNPASRAIVDSGQYIGTKIEEHWPTAMIERIKPDLLMLLEHGGTYDREAVIYPRGVLRAYRMRAFPIPQRRIVLVLENITERKATEAALRESEENYRTIFDSANDAIMIHDAETGRILDANEKTEEMFRYPLDEFISLSVGDFSLGTPPYSDAEALRLIRAAAAGDPQLVEWHCRREGDELFWTEVSLRAVVLTGRRVVLAIVRDISERKELEAKLWQSQRLESIGTLASGVAHEINNPLMGMINYAELISSRSKDNELSRFAEEIKAEGDRVAKIVRNLLSFSRQDREQHSPARLGDIVDASLSIVGSLLRKDFVLIDLDVPEDLPVVRCRSQQIQQILINLLTNARDSLAARFPGADERKILRITAEIVEDGEGRWLRTGVEDAGVGIPEHVVDRIFDPFFTTKGRNKGTGLGLSISYGIARDHGGRLSVESTPNERTRFLLDLPLSEDAASNEGHDA